MVPLSGSLRRGLRLGGFEAARPSPRHVSHVRLGPRLGVMPLSEPAGEATGAQFDAPVSTSSSGCAINLRLCPVLLLLSAASAAVCTVTHTKRFERSPHDDMSVQPSALGGH